MRVGRGGWGGGGGCLYCCGAGIGCGVGGAGAGPLRLVARVVAGLLPVVVGVVVAGVLAGMVGDGPLGQKGQLPPLSGNELKFQEQKSGIAWLRNELFKYT